MRTALVNGRALVNGALRDDVAVIVEDDRIAAVTGSAPADADQVDLGGGILLPGFVDTQVNGGGGLLFNDAPTIDTIATIAAAHRRFGTTGLMPTLISDELAVVAAAIRAVDDAIEAGVPGVLGIHVEGPFLNAARRGIHDAARLRTLDRDAIALLCSARCGRAMVTLAPECVAPGEIAALVAGGVIVSGGHSEADYDTTRRAIGEGLSGFTHLFNAMSPMAGRAPGMTGAALESDAAYAGLIVDGHHLHPAMIRIALAAKGPSRLMLVSDAMSLAGVERDRFRLQGREIRAIAGRLVDEAGTLAGSTLTMADAVRNMIAQAGVDLAAASAMASATPAEFLGMGERRGRIVPGLAADLILVDDALIVRRSWIAGREADPPATVG